MELKLIRVLILNHIRPW